MALPSGRRSAACTGQAPRPRTTGTATWTELCAPASAPRRRSSARSRQAHGNPPRLHAWPAGRIAAMFRLLGLVISVGLADSLNPSTIGPALYLATGRQGRRQVVQFTVGVVLVYFIGGALVTLGPGRLLLSLLPHPHRH